MNREEFDNACRAINKNYNSAQVTDDMFMSINFVYTWYPTISETEGKKQIAYLYMTFGFAIIQDMHERAREALKIDHGVARLKEELSRAELKQAQLKNGFVDKQSDGRWAYPSSMIPC